MRARAAAPLLVLLLAAGPLSGCLDLFGRALEEHRVARTPIDTEGWNRDGLFTVEVREAESVHVRIEAKSPDGRVLRAEGPSSATLPPVRLEIPDGTWTVTYWLDGTRWERFRDARFDGTPPQVTGLQALGQATPDGRYTIGDGAVVEPGADVQVVEQSTGRVVAESLPATVTGLGTGIHAYDVLATDAAGNRFLETVQVRAGSATQLPEGSYTLGLVARYTIEAAVWDLTGLEQWPSPEQARALAGGRWLGDGRAITPDHEAVRDAVAQAVQPGMSTGEAALALYRHMADELDYDRSRLEESTLLLPHQTLLDREDTADDDGDGDGLVRDGGGNGVRGGVCRDLAAVYVSLLRAAGIPARLVTGYLGGEVDGFHAWVEFYGGDGHGPSPWVPVDVSAIDGAYDPAIALQAFGMRHTDMLGLRVITESQEQGEWSTAVAVSTRYPAGDEPQVELAKADVVEFEVGGVLCVDFASLDRAAIQGERVDDCPSGFTRGLAPFVLRASHVLDYGAEVRAAADGTTVTVELAYPEAAAVVDGTVETVFYGAPFRKDEGKGTAEGAWTS